MSHVMMLDELVMDYVVVFEGDLEACEAVAAEDEEYFVEEW